MSANPNNSQAVTVAQGLNDSQGTSRGETIAGLEAACPWFAAPAVPGEVGRLGPYRVLRQLGAGGMGAVYAALDTRLDQQLALKVMLPKFAADTAARERFLREARATARISHDNVVTVYEADERDGVPYIAMQYLQGYSLEQFLARCEKPTLAQVLRIGWETASGLAAAHRIGLIHRDIKPANLWLEAPQGRVKVLDFGLARPIHADAELTRSGMLVGTPAFMSPEQAQGLKLDPRSDLFSLGVVLYRLVTGRMPFAASDTMGLLLALEREDPRPVHDFNPEVPDRLAELIHRMLAKPIAHRPSSAEEVQERLKAIARSEASLPSAKGPAVRVDASISVHVGPDANPFADLDGGKKTPAQGARLQPSPSIPERPFAWLIGTGVAFLALVGLMVGAVVLFLNQQAGSLPKPGPTVVPEKPPAVAATPTDFWAAEHALSLGGTVRVQEGEQDLRTVRELPREPFRLTSLDLTGLPIRDSDLALFKECTELSILILARTKLTDAGLAHFAGCRKLTQIHLSSTKVSDVGLAHFRGCPELIALSLNETLVTDAGLSFFKDCRGLTNLSVEFTQVTDAGLAHFQHCRRLSQLYLSDTQVTDDGLALFKNQKGLTRLALSRTAVTNAGLAHFQGIAGLNLLYLGNTQLTDAGLVNFKGCAGLKFLQLAKTGVTDSGLAHLRECKKLTHVWLGDTRVTDVGLAHLQGCNDLVLLSMENTAVTDGSLNSLLECRLLQTLDVRKTSVTLVGLQAFQAAVPGCKITYDGGTLEPR